MYRAYAEKKPYHDGDQRAAVSVFDIASVAVLFPHFGGSLLQLFGGEGIGCRVGQHLLLPFDDNLAFE